MRTTITLEPDVAKRLERLREKQRGSFKGLVNAVLRAGLEAMDAPAPVRKPYQITSWSGEALIPDLSNVAEVLAFGEGESYR